MFKNFFVSLMILFWLVGGVKAGDNSPYIITLSFLESNHSKAFSVDVSEDMMATIDISALHEVYGVKVEVLDPETRTICVKFYSVINANYGEAKLVETKVISRRDIYAATENTNAEFVFRAQFSGLTEKAIRGDALLATRCDTCCVTCERIPGWPTTVCGIRAICDTECCTCDLSQPCPVAPPKH